MSKLNNILINRIGEENINNQGLKMKIIDYKNNSNVDVIFDDGTICKTTYYYFKKGTVVNYNIPTYLGVGYLGYGEYKSRFNNVKTEEYIKWGSMLTRCYSEKLSEKDNYANCTVCDEWHNFQNFAKWFDNNKYTPPFNDTLELDKDIKIKNNKMYSPETCLLVPKRINSIILNRKNDRGKCCIGVSKNGHKYIANVNQYGNKRTYIGTFDTELEAFYAYKKYKENVIKETANMYKSYIPKELYDSLLNYKIEIFD